MTGRKTQSLNRREALRIGAAGAVSLALQAGSSANARSAALRMPPAPAPDRTEGDDRKTVILSDMSQCWPRRALADRLTRGKWKQISYEAGPYHGVMLWSPTGNAPGRITLPLGVTGWHRVFVGVGSPVRIPATTLFRFTKEPAFIPRRAVNGMIEECPLGAWDLTGQDLEIAARTGGSRPPAGVAYVRLEPISEAEGRRLSAQGRGITVSIDGFSYFHSRNPQTAQELWEEVWYLKQSDVDTVILQCGGADTTNYTTRVGTMMGNGLKLFPRPGDGDATRTIAMMARKGINPTREMIDAAHACGIETLIGYRPAAWQYAEPYHDFASSPYYVAHPEWRTYDRDGTMVPRLSYAIPEVRSHAVEVLRESVRFGADGVCVMFNRGTPLVLFEPPFSKPFQAKYGVDPHDLPDEDPRVLEMRADYIGAFMREVRAMLDEEGKARGTRLKLAAIALDCEANNRYYGVDLPGWIDAGLIDSLVAWSSADDVGRQRKASLDLAYYHALCAPKRIPFRAAIIGWQMDSDPKKNAERFAQHYAAGADGVMYWDANSIEDQRLWQPLSRFGSHEQVEAFAQAPAPERVVWAPHKVGDIVVDGRFRFDQGF